MNAAVYLNHNHEDIRIAGSISIPNTLNCTFIYFGIPMNLLRNVFSFKLRWSSALYSTENTCRLIVLWSDIYYLMIRIIVLLSLLTSTLYQKEHALFNSSLTFSSYLWQKLECNIASQSWAMIILYFTAEWENHRFWWKILHCSKPWWRVYPIKGVLLLIAISLSSCCFKNMYQIQLVMFSIPYLLRRIVWRKLSVINSLIN